MIRAVAAGLLRVACRRTPRARSCCIPAPKVQGQQATFGVSGGKRAGELARWEENRKGGRLSLARSFRRFCGHRRTLRVGLSADVARRRW
eukprot:11350082-Alexandrium_andersonii.AAC.1